MSGKREPAVMIASYSVQILSETSTTSLSPATVPALATRDMEELCPTLTNSSSRSTMLRNYLTEGNSDIVPKLCACTPVLYAGGPIKPPSECSIVPVWPNERKISLEAVEQTVKHII